MSHSCPVLQMFLKGTDNILPISIWAGPNVEPNHSMAFFKLGWAGAEPYDIEKISCACMDVAPGNKFDGL